MKTLITLAFILIAVLISKAEIGSKVIIPANGSNYVSRGTSTTAFANRLSAGEHFGTAARTNLAYLATNVVVGCSSTSPLLVVGAFASAPLTNVYYLTRSADGVNWQAWTNVTVTAANGVQFRTTVELPTLAQYPYVQLVNVSNISTIAASLTNYVSLHWK